MTVSQSLAAQNSSIDLKESFGRAVARLMDQKNVFKMVEETNRKEQERFIRAKEEYQVLRQISAENGNPVYDGETFKMKALFGGVHTFSPPSYRTFSVYNTTGLRDLCNAEGFLVADIHQIFKDKAADVLEKFYSDIPALMNADSKSRMNQVKEKIGQAGYITGDTYKFTPLSELFDLEVIAASVAIKIDKPELIDQQMKKLRQIEIDSDPTSSAPRKVENASTLSGARKFLRRLGF